eukprot:1416052-Alexandrium_andersonii.AAC.1
MAASQLVFGPPPFPGKTTAHFGWLHALQAGNCTVLFIPLTPIARVSAYSINWNGARVVPISGVPFCPLPELELVPRAPLRK